jgi:2-dehydro-3-deoxy-L-rhamnonate dehydrogenase (NAD+)
MSVPLPAALVTGGGSGIGAACCRRLSRAGYRVIVADIDEAAAKTVAADIGGVAAVVDCCDPDAVNDLVGTVVRAEGRLAAAVNSAGIAGPPQPIAEYSTQDWRRVLSVNLDGVFHCVRAEVRAMRESGGSIVNIASVFAAVGAPLAPAYTAAKHGVAGLTRSAALAHAEDGIRVNAVGPGFVRTPLLEDRNDDEGLAQLAGLHPMGRLGTPDDIAALAVWLCGPEAGFVTGAFFPIDGGYLSR